MFKNVAFGFFLAVNTASIFAAAQATGPKVLPSDVTLPATSGCQTPGISGSLFEAIENNNWPLIFNLFCRGFRLSQEESAEIWNIVGSANYVPNYVLSNQEQIAKKGLAYYDYLLDYDELKIAIKNNDQNRIYTLVCKGIYILPETVPELAPYHLGRYYYLSLVRPIFGLIPHFEGDSFLEKKCSLFSRSDSPWNVEL